MQRHRNVYGKWVLMIGMILLASCSSKPLVKDPTPTVQKPEWITKQGKYDKGLGAIGSSIKSPLGTQAQRDKAILAGRTQLTRQLATIVQTVATESRNELQQVGAKEDAEVIARQFNESTTRQVANELLVGSTPIEEWLDPVNGELTVWVVIDEKNIVPRLRASMQKQLDAVQGDHRQALDEMDRQIQKALESQKQQ